MVQCAEHNSYCVVKSVLKEQEANLKCALLKFLVHFRAKVLLKAVAEKPAGCSAASATSKECLFSTHARLQHADVQMSAVTLL